MTSDLDAEGAGIASASARETLRKAFEASPSYVLVASWPDERIVSANRVFLQATGHVEARIKGRTPDEIGLWADPDEYRRWRTDFVAESEVREREVWLRTSDGRPLFGSLTAVPIELEKGAGMLIMVRDITTQKDLSRKARELNEKYGAVFQNNPAACAISRGVDGVMLEVNDAWVRCTLRPRESAVGRSAIELGLWASIADRTRLRERFEAEGELRDQSIDFARADGTHFEALLSLSRLKLGRRNCVVWTWSDMTRSGQGERALAEQQAAAEWMRLEHGVARILADSESAKAGIEEVCKAVCESTGWLCGRYFRAYEEAGLLRFDAAWGSLDPAVQRFIEGSQGLSMRRGEGLTGEVWRTGRALWIREAASDPRILGKALVREFGPYGAVVLPVVSQSRVIGVFSFSSRALREQDQRQMESLQSICNQTGQFLRRKSIERALRESEERFRRLTELSSDFYWEQDEQYRFLQRSGEGLHAPGFPAEDVHGKTRWELDCPDMTEEDWARHRADLEARRTFKDFVIARPGADGQTHYYSLSGEPTYRSDGRFRGYRGVGKEVTGRVRAEARVRELNVTLEQKVRERTAELETANRDLDSFSYSVSHDLKAPIGAINGFAYLLRTKESARLSQDGTDLLGLIEKNAERILGLVDGLLAFSQLGRKSVLGTRLQMGTLLDEAIDELRLEQRWREVDLTIGPMPDCRGDALLLRQVWKNLIANALKFSRARQPAIVAIGYDEAAAAYYVRDNGAGFDMRYAQKLFAVFERLHDEGEFEGTGVGLAIVQRIVQRHGGTVSAEGEPGAGAIFRFSLPS
jgi:PAS domain S-box-containing protein